MQVGKDVDQIISDRRMDEILNVINDKREDDLEAMFSVTASNKSKTLQQDVKKLFEQFDGSELTWKDNDGPIVYESNDYGVKCKKIINWYEVFSSKGNKYIFFFVEWIVDDRNNNNEGLYTLRIMRDKDLEVQFYEHSRMEIPGIYYNPSSY